MKKELIKKYIVDDNFIVDDIFVFSDNNKSFLLNKKGCSMFVDGYLLNNIKNRQLDENLKFKMIQRGLARIKGSNIYVKNRRNKGIYFVIDVTKKCNFNCLYCFRNLNDSRTISNDRLKDICEYILNVAKKRKLSKISVQVWGGEPLLAMDKLEFIYSYFKDTDVSLKIDIETNGSLITESVARRLYEMHVNIGVSIDGSKEHQDFQRRLVNNKKSSTLVEKGISNLKKYYGKNLSGITVITKYNYKDIVKIIDYFTNELGISSMKFNIVRDNPNANERRIGLSLEEVREFANKLFDTIELYNVLGIKFDEGNIHVRTSNLLERTNNNYCLSNGCKGGTNLLSIDMNGDIYPCEMMDYKEVKIGSIYKDGKISSNSDLIKQINDSKKSSIYFKKKINKECKNCPWQYYCKGGCTSRILYSNGKMKYDEIECEFNKVIYERIINQMLKNIR